MLQKFEYSADVLTAMEAMKGSGGLRLWGSAVEGLERQQVELWELRRVGILDPEKIGKVQQCTLTSSLHKQPSVFLLRIL